MPTRSAGVGDEGGKLAKLADLSIVVHNNCIEQIEDIHLCWNIWWYKHYDAPFKCIPAKLARHFPSFPLAVTLLSPHLTQPMEDSDRSHHLHILIYRLEVG